VLQRDAKEKRRKGEERKQASIVRLCLAATYLVYKRAGGADTLKEKSYIDVAESNVNRELESQQQPKNRTH
jgi:hypothetical protein